MERLHRERARHLAAQMADVPAFVIIHVHLEAFALVRAAKKGRRCPGRNRSSSPATGQSRQTFRRSGRFRRCRSRVGLVRPSTGHPPPTNVRRSRGRFFFGGLCQPVRVLPSNSDSGLPSSAAETGRQSPAPAMPQALRNVRRVMVFILVLTSAKFPRRAEWAGEQLAGFLVVQDFFGRHIPADLRPVNMEMRPRWPAVAE